MYLGVYGCFCGIFYLLGAGWLARRQGALWAYSARAWSASLLALVGFEVFSIWAGLIPFRGVGSFSYPGDYLAAGVAGWGTMLLLPAGILAPLLIAAWSARCTLGP